MFSSSSLHPPNPTTISPLSVSDNDPVNSVPPPLRIAIIGFNNYAQFLAETLVSQGHTLFAHSPSPDHSAAASLLGVSFFTTDLHDLFEQHPDVVVLSTSILSTENILKSLQFHRLLPNTLFVDVLSVKEFAKTLLLRYIPQDFDILCTHPMFNPQSVDSNHGKWLGLRFVYDKVRIGEEDRISRKCESFLGIFEREGCEMVEMSCADHDRYAAGSQFVTHTVGRVLETMKLETTLINTKGYEALLGLAENARGDSFDLYYELFLYNKNSLEMLERMDCAFESLRKELFARLHGVVREQLLFESETQKKAVNDVSLDMMRSKDVAFNDSSRRLKIGIVGFGNFGQFLAKTMVKQGHTVLAYSRTDYTDAAAKLGVSYFSDVGDLCEENPEVILLCTSILSTEKVVKSLPFHRLKRSTLFVDVLSVKEFAKTLLLQALPQDFDILCTHPMFGPESGKNGWNGLSFVFDKVRIGMDDRCDSFLDIFAREGCSMVEMSCAEHDRHAAGSQFITHTVGRVLEKLGLESTPVDTKGYETLLKLVENTAGDSFDLYYGLFLYNPNAMEQLERFCLAFQSLKKLLFGRLHRLLHKQMFGNDRETLIMLETTGLSAFR